MTNLNTPARVYAEGIGEAVADRTINRTKPDGSRETWADVAERVATGNALLCPDKGDIGPEFESMRHHLRQASILMSGRHLQHGDAGQTERNQEVFTNCSTAATSHILFYLLLNGSGVGRSYDDHMMFVDWRDLPEVYIAIDANYPDRSKGLIDDEFPTVGAVLAEMAGDCDIFVVDDSREGWAHAVEHLESLAFHKVKTPTIFDFSKVRPNGSPIRGMQNRPSSGPAATMNAMRQVAALRNASMQPWEQAMHADHFLAESVLVGGARRAARMATKTWRDESVLDFIKIKQSGGLWSSNNSVTVDEEFWQLAATPASAIQGATGAVQELWGHAKAVFEAVCHHSYHDRSGEPGLINADKLTAKNEGMEVFDEGEILGSARFQPAEAAKPMHKEALRRFKSSTYKMITNPCGEITLTMLGGYCVIADVVPYHAQNLDDAEDAFRTATRALIRTNLMDCLYRKEVDRTNRIGVGMTGLHEFAYKFFGYGWKDLVDESKSKDFWLTLSRFKRAVTDEAAAYAGRLGVAVPHTNTTMKPAGTTSKLFGLTEGAHLPAMREYLRYVQFRNDDPLVEKYAAAGYPIRKLVKYAGTTVVGFPTIPEICTLGMGDKLVTASEATPEEQYEYLRLLERYYIVGVEEDGVTPLPESGNQVSYTLKYDPEVVSYEEFKRTMLDGQSSVRCCSVMPAVDASVYEYQPETPVSREEFDALMSKIQRGVKEDVGFEHVDCGTGACPISWDDSNQSETADAPTPTAAEWIVFSTKVCPACQNAKRLLNERGIAFEEVILDSAEAMSRLRRYSASTSVPVIVRNGDVIGGLNDLQAYLAK